MVFPASLSSQYLPSPSLQVARTINNMQQQIQQHQRQLYQALLMKQQPPSSHPGLHHPSSSSGLHSSSGPAAGKSALDSFSGHSQASLQGLSDLQAKDTLQSSPNSYSHYPICEWPKGGRT